MMTKEKTMTDEETIAALFGAEEIEELNSLARELSMSKETMDDLEKSPELRAYNEVKKAQAALSSKLRKLIASKIPTGGIGLNGEWGSVKVSKSTMSLEVVAPELLDDGFLDDIHSAEMSDGEEYLVMTLVPSKVLGLVQRHPGLGEELVEAGVMKRTWTSMKTNVYPRG